MCIRDSVGAEPAALAAEHRHRPVIGLVDEPVLQAEQRHVLARGPEQASDLESDDTSLAEAADEIRPLGLQPADFKGCLLYTSRCV